MAADGVNINKGKLPMEGNSTQTNGNENNIKETQSLVDSNGWTIPTRRRRIATSKLSKGSENPTAAKSKLLTVERKTWIFLSNFNPGVTEEDILDCLNEYAKENYVCKKLMPKYENPKAVSFRIGVPTHLGDTFKSLTFWPKGTFVDTYHFKKLQSKITETHHPERNMDNSEQGKNFQIQPTVVTPT